MNRPIHVKASIFGAALFGGQAELVRVEVLLSRGLPKTLLVGMPDIPAKEARERLPSALAAFGFQFPKARVLFNLVPAQIPKGGLPLDLAMATALLQALGGVKQLQESILLLAELDLEGRLRPPARGTLLATLRAAEGNQIRTVITAVESATEAAIAPNICAIGCADLGEVAAVLNGKNAGRDGRKIRNTAVVPEDLHSNGLLLEDIRGQNHARWAGILAVAGRHPLLLQGPPGTGKSMLAMRLASLLPPLEEATAMDLARVEALIGPVTGLPTRAPFRSPHPSVSAQGIFGGGRPLRPGEISRAHGGLLFLDEFPEFQRPVLEGLRQPLEEKEVRLQRAQEWATFPADVLLVAARNPCPCGFATHPVIPCECTPHNLHRYRNRTSGPLLDRFDLFAEMSPVAPDDLQAPPTQPTQQQAIDWIAQAHKQQIDRKDRGSFSLASQASLETLKAEGISQNAWRTMVRAADTLHLSSRGVLRCLRVARTLADGEGLQKINRSLVLRALSFRPHSPSQALTTN